MSGHQPNKWGLSRCRRSSQDVPFQFSGRRDDVRGRIVLYFSSGQKVVTELMGQARIKYGVILLVRGVIVRCL